MRYEISAGRACLREKDQDRRESELLFAFNDMSAIGAIGAIRHHKLEVPRDVSVVGFDDIQSAAFHSPQLTTVRQPLKKMGLIAAEALLRRIARPDDNSYRREIVIEPELIVRQSTACAAG